MNVLRFTIVLLIFGMILPISAQEKLLKSGPMLGPMTLRDATLWLQTSDKATVYFSYRLKGSKDEFRISDKKETKSKDNFIVTTHLSDIEPGKTYEYKSFINDKELKLNYPTEFTTQVHWQYRTDAPDFKFIAGSCLYINDTEFDRPGKPYGGEYAILNSMYKTKPDFMVWLGDNTYLREGDFESRSGIFYRQGHTRALNELQPFLSSIPQYAIWDDHDYGTNDSDWTYPLKKHSLNAFKKFWPNESYGAGHTEGVTSSFNWNDCQFIMLDNRWYRTVVKENGTILGEQQKFWLKEALLASKASFKFVCVGGQFLSDAAIFENFANYPEERNEIIQFIDDHDIKGVVFLTGDRHHSEITKLKTEKGNVFYDVTSSAITSSTYDHSSEPNTLRVKGSMLGVRNYGIFSVSGDRKNRKLGVVFKDTNDQELYKYDFEF